MAPPPPSPSPSGSGSESGPSSAATSSDEEQQQQQHQETAQAKTSPPPLKKKAVVPKRKQWPPLVEEEHKQKTKPQQRAASPPHLKKKPVLNDNKKPPPSVAPSAVVPAAAAADDSGSEEDGSDSPPAAKPAKPTSPPPRRRGPDPSSSIEPISSSEPLDGTGSPQGTKPEEPPPAAATQRSRADKKRKRQRQEAGDAQEGHAAAAAGGPSSKKLFQRVWTEENEIALLQGMLNFQAKRGGAHPASDIDAFSVFVSAALQGDFSKSQIYEKIRRLRTKYERSLRRGKKGADPSFAKPHEQAAFELSKKVWPTVEGDTHDYGGDDKGGKMDYQRAGLLYPMLTEAISLLEKENGNNFLARSVSRALDSLKPTKARALEDRWNKHFIAGAKYFLERTRLKKNLLESLVNVLDGE